MRSNRSIGARHGVFMLTSTCVSALLAGCATQITPDPSDPGLAVKPMPYESVVTRSAARTGDSDSAQLPWKKLFNADGTFVPETDLSGTEERTSDCMDGGASTAREMALPGSGSDGQGVVKAIYRERNKVKLKHGPIEKLEMPGMTMVFGVADPTLLEEIEEGEELGFTIEMQGTAFVVTGFQSLDGGEAESAQSFAISDTSGPAASDNDPTPSADGSDGRGVVKAIYRERNKVKLKHGPIEKLEMPGMTMVFGVADPTLLEQIEEGEELGFTIEMQGTAFVVTGFQK